MRAIFTITIFLSAFLLFAVQPMVGKLVLPKLGGSPAVWNTCMVFFQSLLLLGYAYVHLLSQRASVKTQVVIHCVLLAAAALALPIALPATLPAQMTSGASSSGNTISIIIWLIAVLGLTAGAPFLVLSATAPLLQKWFSKTADPRAADPYFLYAASNAGSVAGLVAYPVVIEPSLGIAMQGKAWSIGYGVLTLCLVAAGIMAVRMNTTAEPTAAEKPANSVGPTWADRLRWIALAAVPSSVSLGVTQYISTDIAAVPLIWVVPLLIYLASFIFAFSKRGVNVDLWGRILAISCCVIAFPILSGSKSPTMVIVGMHLFVLLAASMTCHGRLARERPSAEHLTEYYLLMSAGGMLGGICNAILAPMLLPIVFEYQLAMVAAVMLRPRPTQDERGGIAIDILAIMALIAVLVLGGVIYNRMQPTQLWVVQGLLYGLPAILCALMLFGGGRRRFAIGLLIMFLSAPLRNYMGDEHAIYTTRTFFGVHRVFEKRENSWHLLYHGTTLHGVEPRNLQQIVPATYYHRTGPIGQLLKQLAGDERMKRVAAIGLGTGSIAAYIQPGCTMHFYEIDPAVIAIASEPKYFRYLQSARGNIEFSQGDGRLEIAKAPDHSYGVIIVDAFSSDAIPTHLLTREALAIYRSKLQPGGILAIHISNIYFNLEPVVAALADDCGMVGRIQNNDATQTERDTEAKNSSTWCVLAANEKDLGRIAMDGRWLRLRRMEGDPVWTDDYSNILKVLNWGE